MILLTGDVSTKWMERNHLYRWYAGEPQFAVPTKTGKVWKKVFDLTDEDYDTIEKYHAEKTKSA